MPPNDTGPYPAHYVTIPKARPQTTLTELFVAHEGLLSDKWEQYLGVYDSELASAVAAGRPLSVLEIGVQNGGSLELWAKFLPPASRITGIDIDPACSALSFNGAIEVLTGDAANNTEVTRLLGSRTFDLIIDDGSHRCCDVIKTFRTCFEYLNPGGLYFIEDLHCSYLPAFGGGFRARGSAVEALKSIIDAINLDHIDVTTNMSVEEIRTLAALNRQVARVAFYDSIAVIEKMPVPKERRYRRVMTGTDMPVANPALPLLGLSPAVLRDLRLNWATEAHLAGTWSEMLANSLEEMQRLRATDQSRAEQLAQAAERVAIQERALEELHAKLHGYEQVVAGCGDTLSTLLEEGASTKNLLEAKCADRGRLVALEQEANTLRETSLLHLQAREAVSSVNSLQAAEIERLTIALRDAQARHERQNHELDELRGEIRRIQAEHLTWRNAGETESVVKEARIDELFQLAETRLRAIEDLSASESRFHAELQADRARADHAASIAELAQRQRNSLLQSRSWRITRPLRLCAEIVRGRRLREEDASLWLASADQPVRPPTLLAAALRAAAPQAPVDMPVDARKTISERVPNLRVLNVYRVPQEAPRIVMVTDSINSGSLFGGVGTALLFSAALARHRGMNLLVITRTQPPEPSNFATVLAANDFDWEGNVEFIHAPLDGGREIPIGDHDTFITTSWWTTWAVRQTIDPDRIVYLLQEDERMFYPHGDDRLRCAETLADSDIRFVINSQLLFDHLVTGHEPLPNLKARGLWFEPAFPAFRMPETRQKRPSGKRRFLFYARPQNLRNLYWRGLEAIVSAIEDGILKPEEWEFIFVGRDLAPVMLPYGASPRLMENLPWPDYVELVRTIDLGLSLIDTPHPSYPPLDLAASGALVVTNSAGIKTNLEDVYSDRIICTEPTLSGLREGLAQAVKRLDAGGDQASPDSIGRDWNAAFAKVIETMYPISGKG